MVALEVYKAAGEGANHEDRGALAMKYEADVVDAPFRGVRAQ